MKYLFHSGVKSLSGLIGKVSNEIDDGYFYLKEKLNGLPIFISLEHSSKYESDKVYDEKHYFVVPCKLSPFGFALHTMRCLPNDAPQINTLPKRRVFHFSNPHDEHALEEYLVATARDLVVDTNFKSQSGLELLADQIDRIDNKMTYGVLLIGGLAAIVNPAVGTLLATQSIIPATVGLLNKFGLKPLGQKLSEQAINKQIKISEENIRQEFEAANTLKIINPILQELEFALRTTQSEHDPLIDFDLSECSIDGLKGERWRALTCTAVSHIYDPIVSDPSIHQKAQLGPEDLRWLKVVRQGMV